MIMSVINSFLTYDYVYLMTSGGPAHSTEMLSTYAYTFAFASLQVGKASGHRSLHEFFGLIASLSTSTCHKMRSCHRGRSAGKEFIWQ